jgi:hypothetical protein
VLSFALTASVGLGVGVCLAQPALQTPGQTPVETHWELYRNGNWRPSSDQHLSDPVLIGAIDLHVHSGPDAYPRQWDAFETAEIAASRGMRAIVLKNHWTETAGLAELVNDHVGGGLEVFGALALNTPVGGLNPRALRYMVEVSGGRGRVVWMPTHESEHEVEIDGTQRPFVRVSENGRLLPEVFEILDLIAERGLTLATGHVTPTEALAIMREAKDRGITRIIVTHPTLGEQYTYMSDDELRQAVALGGVIEITAGSLYRAGGGRDRALEVIGLVGPENAFVGSDSGLIGTPNVPDALVMAARVLREAGYKEPALDRMFKNNPARLLGLPDSNQTSTPGEKR